jgi:zinc protease
MNNKVNLLLVLAMLSAMPSDAQGVKKATQETTKASSGQAKLIEKISRKGNEIRIPYQKHVLSNGLTLLIHEDHSDPIVHVDVTYHVGSAREEIGKSGFAHFFEHMMFQGSDNVGDEQHFKIVTESGGTLNGTTNRDRTNYFETLPSNQLETALWLEADRMGFLLDAVTQQKFEVQRETVKNERGQRYDNAPYGLAAEYISKNLYPYGHPYSWMTIGYIEDLNRVDVNDLKRFFLRWYGPNNATLTIGGDVNPAEVVKSVEKYFGSIPKGPEVTSVKLPAPALEKNRYVSYEDNVRMPMLRVVMPTVPARHEDEPALDCLAEILGSGKNSMLYKNFVKTQKAVQASAYNYGSELSGELSFTILSYPGKSLKESEELLQETLKEFEKRGVTDEDIKRFVANYESSTINSLASVSRKVSQLASNQTFTGNPDYITKEYKAYTSVKKEDVMRVYNKYVKGKNAVILSVVPKGQSALIAAADNHTVSKEGYKAPEKDQYAGLSYIKAKDTFDRSKKPASGANPVVNVPAYWTSSLSNGIAVIGTKSNEIPTVTMLLRIKGGHMLSASDPSKAGVANLTASMLNEDTEKYTAEELTNELDKLGSNIYISAGNEEISVTIQSQVKNLDATLKLAEEKLFKPKFDQEDFDRLKKQQLELIANQSVQPTTIANKVFAKLLYGENNILSVPTSGTTATVNNISLEDVKTFYSKYFSPSVTNLVIVGDIDEKTALAKLEFLKKWNGPAVTLPAEVKVPAIEKTKIYLINKDNAAQSEIRIGYLGIPYDATGNYYRAYLLNYPLGGAFNSRINLNLREDKGYTYGARSGFSGSKIAGPFSASAGVRANATDSSLVEFIKEITLYKDKGMSEDELAFMKKSIGQSDALKYETPIQKAYFLNRIIEYKLDKDFVKEQNDILTSIKTEELNELAAKLLPVDKMHMVIVGDKKLVEPGLKKLGYEVVELDTEGNVIIAASTVESTEESPATPSVPVKKVSNKKKK